MGKHPGCFQNIDLRLDEKPLLERGSNQPNTTRIAIVRTADGIKILIMITLIDTYKMYYTKYIINTFVYIIVHNEK